jgi:hypothetical protein
VRKHFLAGRSKKMMGWPLRNTNVRFVLPMVAIPFVALAGDAGIAGQVTDPQGKPVSGACGVSSRQDTDRPTVERGLELLC